MITTGFVINEENLKDFNAIELKKLEDTIKDDFLCYPEINDFTIDNLKEYRVQGSLTEIAPDKLIPLRKDSVSVFFTEPQKDIGHRLQVDYKYN